MAAVRKWMPVTGSIVRLSETIRLNMARIAARWSRLIWPVRNLMAKAEAISVINNGMALAGHFGDGVLHPRDVAAGLIGAVIKDPVQDTVVWKEYLEIVVKEREDWKPLYRACMELE